jgi:hypothetical protein
VRPAAANIRLLEGCLEEVDLRYRRWRDTSRAFLEAARLGPRPEDDEDDEGEDGEGGEGDDRDAGAGDGGGGGGGGDDRDDHDDEAGEPEDDEGEDGEDGEGDDGDAGAGDGGGARKRKQPGALPCACPGTTRVEHNGRCAKCRRVIILPSDPIPIPHPIEPDDASLRWDGRELVLYVARRRGGGAEVITHCGATGNPAMRRQHWGASQFEPLLHCSGPGTRLAGLGLLHTMYLREVLLLLEERARQPPRLVEGAFYPGPPNAARVLADLEQLPDVVAFQDLARQIADGAPRLSALKGGEGWSPTPAGDCFWFLKKHPFLF